MQSEVSRWQFSTQEWTLPPSDHLNFKLPKALHAVTDPSTISPRYPKIFHQTSVNPSVHHSLFPWAMVDSRPAPPAVSPTPSKVSSSPISALSCPPSSPFYISSISFSFCLVTSSDFCLLVFKVCVILSRRNFHLTNRTCPNREPIPRKVLRVDYSVTPCFSIMCPLLFCHLLAPMEPVAIL